MMWCLLTRCLDHLRSHWFLSNPIFSFHIMFLFLSHQIYSNPTPAPARRFLLQLWCDSVYPHCTSAALLLSGSSKVTVIAHLTLRLSELVSYHTQNQKEKRGKEKEALQPQTGGRPFPTPHRATECMAQPACLVVDEQNTFHNVNFKCLVLFSSSNNIWIKS